MRKLASHSVEWDVPPPTHNYTVETPCRRWTGATHKSGYGQVADTQGVMRSAHRLALELHLGRPIAPQHDAAHKCDRRLCIAIDHLYEATRQQNVMDKAPEIRSLAGAVEGNVSGRQTGGKLRGGARAKADRDLQPGVFRNPQKPGRFIVAIRHHLLGDKKTYFGIYGDKESANAVAEAVYVALATGDVERAWAIRRERTRCA